jgi:hypothetical protein
MIVDNFKKNLESSFVEEYPYPHIYLKNVFGVNTQDKISFPDLNNYNQSKININNIHLGIRLNEIKDEDLKKFWKPLIDYLISDDFFQIMSKKFNIKNKKISQDAHFGINTPVKKVSSVRGPHFDNTKVLYAGLIYLRDADDDSSGGNFRIFEKKVNNFSITEGRAVSDDQVKFNNEFAYGFGNMILFKNTPVSVHSVSAREKTSHVRKYISFNATTDLDIFKIQPKVTFKNKIKRIFNFFKF